MIAVLITPLNIHKSIYYAKFILNLIIHFSCLKEKQTYSTSLRRKINKTEHSVEIAAEKKEKKTPQMLQAHCCPHKSKASQ